MTKQKRTNSRQQEQDEVELEQEGQRRRHLELDRRAEGRGDPELEPQQGGGIAGDQQHGGQRTAPVAHPHPPLADPAAPAEPVPARQSDPADPARLLADGGVERLGEMAARGDQGAASRMSGNAHEHGRRPDLAEAQAKLVILGQAVGRERIAAAPGGEPGKRPALDRAADPGERDRGADRLAHDHFLAVALGELVAIMTGDPAAAGLGSGRTGNWTRAARSTSLSNKAISSG